MSPLGTSHNSTICKLFLFRISILFTACLSRFISSSSNHLHSLAPVMQQKKLFVVARFLWVFHSWVNHEDSQTSRIDFSAQFGVRETRCWGISHFVAQKLEKCPQIWECFPFLSQLIPLTHSVRSHEDSFNHHRCRHLSR